MECGLLVVVVFVAGHSNKWSVMFTRTTSIILKQQEPNINLFN